MRVLVTGGSGFIGRHFLGFLLASGVESIRVLGRHPVKMPGCEDLVVPELSAAFVERAVAGNEVDVVVHLAASGVDPQQRDVETLMNINVMLPPKLVNAAAAAGVRAMVIAGSCAEYRGQAASQPLSEDAPLESRKIYGATKAAGGMLALAQATANGVPVAVVRLFNVFGANEAPHRLLPTLIRHLRSGAQVPLSEGSQVRDFVHVHDACRGLWEVVPRLIDGSMRSGFYNLATGVGSTVASFARHVARCLGADQRLLHFGAIPMRSDELPYVVGDASALRSACGWRPLRSLEEGISEAVSSSLRGSA